MFQSRTAFRSMPAAALIAALSGVASAADLSPLRPPVLDARTLLVEGQSTPFGAVLQITSATIAPDGSVYTVARIQRDGQPTQSVLRHAPGAGDPVRIVSVGVQTTTGETLESVTRFALLPPEGRTVFLGSIREPGAPSAQWAYLRVDSPESVTVLLKQNDPAPAPLTRLIETPILRDYHAYGQTHIAGAVTVTHDEPYSAVHAIVRLSDDGDLRARGAAGWAFHQSLHRSGAPDGGVLFGSRSDSGLGSPRARRASSAYDESP